MSTPSFCEANPNACNSNGSNNLIYDDCYYTQWLHDSTSPFKYQMYEGKFENNKKCRSKDGFFHPYDLVDIESELKNQTRPASGCGAWKYNPNYKHPGCVSFKQPDPRTYPPNENNRVSSYPPDAQVKQYYMLRQPNLISNRLDNSPIPRHVKNIMPRPANMTSQYEEYYAKPNQSINNVSGGEPMIEGFAVTTHVDKTLAGNSPQVFENYAKTRYMYRPCSHNAHPLHSTTTRCNLQGFSTFDESIPVIYPPELCPIVFNNILKPTSPGFIVPKYI